MKDLNTSSYLENLHDGKHQAEKGIQPVKGSFTSKKGKFAVNLMKKSHTNKILNQLADNNE